MTKMMTKEGEEMQVMEGMMTHRVIKVGQLHGGREGDQLHQHSGGRECVQPRGGK